MDVPVFGESDAERAEARAFEANLLGLRGVQDRLRRLRQLLAVSATANARSIFRRILSTTARRGRRFAAGSESLGAAGAPCDRLSRSIVITSLRPALPIRQSTDQPPLCQPKLFIHRSHSLVALRHR